MAKTQPIAGSVATILMVRSNNPGSAMTAPVASSGLSVAPYAGSTSRRAAQVSGANVGNSTPNGSAMSVLIAQAPPDTEMIATPGICNSPATFRKPAVMMRSSTVRTRMIFKRAQAASNTRLSPTNEPVCAAATEADKALLPTLIITMGLPAACALSAALLNANVSLMVSQYTAMTRVGGCCTRKSTRSAKPIMASLPVAAAKLKPISRRRAMSINSDVVAPLCDISPTDPSRNGSWGGIAVSGLRSAMLANPRLLGPRKRTPAARDMATISLCKATPSAPTSAKPEVKITAVLMPAAMTSAMASRIAVTGTMMYAASIDRPIATQD